MTENGEINMAQTAAVAQNLFTEFKKHENGDADKTRSYLLYMFSVEKVVDLVALYGSTTETCTRMAHVIRDAHDGLVKVKNGEDGYSVDKVVDDLYKALSDIPEQVFEESEFQGNEE